LKEPEKANTCKPQRVNRSSTPIPPVLVKKSIKPLLGGWLVPAAVSAKKRVGLKRRKPSPESSANGSPLTPGLGA